MTLHRASIHRPAGLWPKHEAVEALTLDFEERHHRRVRLMTDRGEAVLLDLPKAVAMAEGDGLQLEDGRWLKVRAAVELVVEVRHGDATQLTRVAWHLGNRHVPTQIGHQVLRIRPDHVIEAMLHRLGADLANVQVPFQPEGGAYSGDGQHHSLREGHHGHER